jgi:hypothetical protein
LISAVVVLFLFHNVSAYNGSSANYKIWLFQGDIVGNITSANQSVWQAGTPLSQNVTSGDYSFGAGIIRALIPAVISAAGTAWVPGAGAGPPVEDIIEILLPPKPECGNFTLHPPILSGEHEPGEYIRTFRVWVYNWNTSQTFSGEFSDNLKPYCEIKKSPNGEIGKYEYGIFEIKCIAPNTTIAGNFSVSASDCSESVKIVIGSTLDVLGDLSSAMASFSVGANSQGLAALIMFLSGGFRFTVAGTEIAIPVWFIIFIIIIVAAYIAGILWYGE